MSSFKSLSNQSLNLYLQLKGSIPILRFMAQGIDFCAHHQANDQTSVLSTEKVQKAQLGPKLWAFEKKFPQKCFFFRVPSFKLRTFCCFHFHYEIFFAISFQTPLKNPSLWAGFLRGVINHLLSLTKSRQTRQTLTFYAE